MICGHTNRLVTPTGWSLVTAGGQKVSPGLTGVWAFWPKRRLYIFRTVFSGKKAQWQVGWTILSGAAVFVRGQICETPSQGSKYAGHDHRHKQQPHEHVFNSIFMHTACRDRRHVSCLRVQQLLLHAAELLAPLLLGDLSCSIYTVARVVGSVVLPCYCKLSSGSTPPCTSSSWLCKCLGPFFLCS